MKIESIKVIVLSICAALGVSYSTQKAEPLMKQEKQTTIQPVRHIIFDLDGVLLTTNKFKAFKHIGLGNSLSYMMHNKKKPSHDTIFNTLHSINCHYNLNGQISYHKNEPMPPIMIAWQMGLEDSNTLLALTHQAIDANPTYNKSTKRVSKKICEIMFQPDTFLKTRQIIAHGLRMLQNINELVQQQNKLVPENEKIQLYVLSNWDKDSCKKLLKSQRFQSIFSIIPKHNCYFSGEHGFVKPNKEVFEDFMQTYGILDPESCILIDDETQNVQAAARLGMHALHCTDNYGKLQEELTTHITQ